MYKLSYHVPHPSPLIATHSPCIYLLIVICSCVVRTLAYHIAPSYLETPTATRTVFPVMSLCTIAFIKRLFEEHHRP